MAGNVAYTPAGTGAVTTDVETKLRESVSVKDFGAVGDGVADDTTKIQAAIDHAVSAGVVLRWSTGDYLTTANLTSLHSVKHVGDGVIKRGSDVFYPAPTGEEPNSIYVSTSGSASNDGLSASEPIRYQDIRAILTNYGPYLLGKWTVEFAAGTYSVSSATAVRIGPDNESDTDPDSLNYTENHITNANLVVFRGVDVGYDPATTPAPVPTTIFDAGGVASAIFDFRGGFRAYVKDIKFMNANGSVSSSGLSCANGQLRAENVHTYRCHYGISGLESCLLEVKGGIIDGDKGNYAASVGIRSLFHVKHDIGSQGAGAVGQGPIIKNCSTGFFVQEGSTGHSDYVTYDSNSTAIRCRVNSRVNINGSEFKNNSVAIVSDGNSVVGWDDFANFYIATADENNDIFQTKGGGRILYAGSNSTDHISYPIDYRTVVLDTDLGTTTATTAEDYYKLISIPKGLMFTGASSSVFPAKVIKVKVTGEKIGTAGSSSFRFRLGELGGTLFLAASVGTYADMYGSFVIEGQIILTEASAQTYSCSINTNYNSVTGQTVKCASGSTTYDTTINSSYQLRASVQNTDAADSVRIDSIEVQFGGIL